MAWILLAAAAAAAASKYASNRSKNKKEKAGAGAQQKAQMELFTAQKGNWDAKEKGRGAKMEAIQRYLQGLGSGSFGAGGSSYAIDPEQLKIMQEARPFPGAPGYDPTKATEAGQGSALASDIFGGISSGLTTYGYGKGIAGAQAGSQVAGYGNSGPEPCPPGRVYVVAPGTEQGYTCE